MSTISCSKDKDDAVIEARKSAARPTGMEYVSLTFIFGRRAEYTGGLYQCG